MPHAGSPTRLPTLPAPHPAGPAGPSLQLTGSAGSMTRCEAREGLAPLLGGPAGKITFVGDGVVYPKDRTKSES